MEENFTPFQKENYLYPLLKGEKRMLKVLEKGSGSDVNGSIKTTAELIDGNYIINGEKWYVTSANKVDFFFLQAKLKWKKQRSTCLIYC